MTSQLNVDTIVDKAGSGGPSLPNTTTIKISNTSTYVGDAGSTTQNLVKGVVTSWGYVNSDASLFSGGSFNMSAGTDNSTGNFTYNLTSNLSGANYAISVTAHDNTDLTGTAYNGTTSDYVVNLWNQAGSLLDTRNRTIAIGDLA